jgi:hypothetical protein
MALPQKRDPYEAGNRLNDIGDQRAVERVSRGGWRWWWIWPVVIAVILWWAGWGWGGTGGWWWGRAGTHNTRIPAPAGSTTTETLANAGAKQPIDRQPITNNYAHGPAQSMVGPGVAILTAQDKQSYIGKSFAANDIPIEQKVNDHAMWIGEKTPMLAVVSGGAAGAASKIVHGMVVDAQGTVEKAPSESQARREWGLNNAEASRLEQEGAYIQVSHLTVPPQ